MKENNLVIAIDGYSSCGKSTLAKALAKELGLSYIDSGAMYRAVTYYILNNHFPIPSKNQIDSAPFDYSKILESIDIKFKFNSQTGTSEIFLNGLNIEKEIRTMEISNGVSLVSSLKEVRVKLVKLQQQMGSEGGLVMDGRDIGTVVFPNADLKIFMKADNTIRAQRRYLELKNQGAGVPLDEVVANLRSRDVLDSTREESPLKQAPDAILLDNTNMTQEEQLQFVLEQVEKLLITRNS